MRTDTLWVVSFISVLYPVVLRAVSGTQWNELLILT